MKIFIDGADANIACEDANKMGNIFHKMKQDLFNQGRAIERVEVDGKAVEYEKFSSGADTLAGTAQIHVVTKSIVDVMHAAVQEAQQYIPPLVKSLQGICNGFRRDKVKESMDAYIKLFPLFNLVLLGISSVQSYLDGKVNFKPQEISAALAASSQALKDKDYVLFCDIVEYKLIAQLQEWTTLLPAALNK